MIFNQLCLILNTVLSSKKLLILCQHLFFLYVTRKIQLPAECAYITKGTEFFGYIQNKGLMTQNKLLNRNSTIVWTLIYVIVLFVWWENFPLWQQLLELHFGLWTSFKSAKRSIYSRKTLQCSGVALQNGVN